MKKVVSLLVVLALFAAFSLGSGEDKKTENTKQIVDGNSNATAEQVDSEATEQATTTEPAKGLPTIEQKVVYDEQGIVITAVEYTKDEFWGNEGIKFLFENNTEKSVTVGTNAVIVNGYMVSDLFVAEVAAGKKTNETLDLLSNQLNAAGITTVGEVEVYFHIYDSESWSDRVDTGCILIQTSEYANMDTEADTSGNVLYAEGGIKIVGKYVDEDSFWGKSIVLYIENNTEQNVIIQAEDVSVNGFTVTSLFSCTVYANRKAYDDITLLSSDLDENGITSVDTVSLKFEIMTEGYDKIAKTEEISFSTK